MEIIDAEDDAVKDLRSSGGNTVWVRPPPALPDLRGKHSQVFVLIKSMLNPKLHKDTIAYALFPDARPILPGYRYP